MVLSPASATRYPRSSFKSTMRALPSPRRICCLVVTLLLINASLGTAQEDGAVDTNGGTGTINVPPPKDSVSMTKEAAELRAHQLHKKKPMLQKKKKLSSILFPGASPEEYHIDDEISMFVDLVTSKNTQVPFDYYKLPVCEQPPKASSKASKRGNLGQRLMGQSTKPTGYKITTKRDISCTPLCKVEIPPTPLRFLRKLVKDQYRIHFTLDNLPVVMRSTELNYVVRGFPLGFTTPAGFNGAEDEELYLFNHFRFTIYYNENEADPDPDYDGERPVRITGFDIDPVSVVHDDTLEKCKDETNTRLVNDPNSFLPLRSGSAGESLGVIYSYEVQWKPSDVAWADRWDIYLMETPDNEIHYYSIVNSLMIALLLTGAVAVIMIRALKKDITNYNDMEDLSVDESGWKLVHGDVFRAPGKGRILLSVAVGTGFQIGTSVLLTLLCAVFKLLNAMKKGQTLTGVVLLYVLSGSVAGYISSRLYKFFGGTSWKRNTVLTAAAFPGVLVTIFIFLNCFLSFRGAATAVSIWTILNIFLLWVCVSIPLVLIGSYFGFRAEKIEVPTKTNQIARFIPEQKGFYLKFPWNALLGGILPFGSVCIELYYVMGALWLQQIYYIMGFILAVCLILTASCSTVSMVMCYFQLCNEDHRWWWKSFFNSASTGFYLFLYSLWYLVNKLQLIGILPVMVYLTYMAMISVAFGLYCGAVGLASSFWFCKKIYGAVKAD